MYFYWTNASISIGHDRRTLKIWKKKTNFPDYRDPCFMLRWDSFTAFDISLLSMLLAVGGVAPPKASLWSAKLIVPTLFSTFCSYEKLDVAPPALLSLDVPR